MYTGNGNPGCIQRTVTPCVYKKKVMGERIPRRLVYWASYWEERPQGLLFGKSGKGVFI